MLTIPYTTLRWQYEKLKALSAEEELQWARAASGTAVGNAFAESVAEFRSYVNDEPFYPAKRPPLAPGDLSRTEHLACLLERAGEVSVLGEPTLNFHYVDREVAPARTLQSAIYSNGQSRTQFVRFDLLLANDVPILAEVKIKSDRAAFYALLQLLTAAAELVTPSQRQRLDKQYGPRPPWTADPRVDVYLIFVDYPVRSPVKMPILRETERIASELVACPAVRPYLRRVAAIHVKEEGPSGVQCRPEFPRST